MKLKTNDLQSNLYTSMAADISVTIINLFLFVPILIPSVETQLMFNEATQNSYKISFDEYYTEKRLLSGMILQVHIVSGQQVSSPKYLNCAHQTQNRINVPYEKNNFAIFDNIDFRKNYFDIDCKQNPRDSSPTNYEKNAYIEQCKVLKLFLKENIRETILNRFISYPDMKTKNPIGIIDIRNQLNHITLKKFNYFKKMALILLLLDCF